ncbi:hypothetical protein [Nostoc sp.]|uniref:hypothetical protein n=1 Tax=Nostoc sp. TaxID=1180 RepID=UPI002FF5BB53
MELDRNPDWREQLITQIEGRPIGFIQIINPAREESHYWGDVAIVWLNREDDKFLELKLCE